MSKKYGSGIQGKYNFVLHDDYIEEMKTFFKKTSQKADIQLHSYLEVLDSICEGNLLEGTTANALSEFTESAKKLDSAILQLGEQVKERLELFLSEIDDIDKKLY